ncbi:MAG: nucleotidyl transferase AbiEii/AbiGii toxin family protein [Candidatus Parabeggiatoa sp.]|nr:nucleotidyl transferase AbiEii/AbiGii toxin family protein [Candidatus Parabeggiatoa sp.]
MIMHPISVFEDVAQAKGLLHPALVEKDFFTTTALSACATVKSDLFCLVFAGGTCLAKSYKLIERMSEDVDIKIIRTEAGMQLSRSQLKKALKGIRGETLEALKSIGMAVPPDREHLKSRNEYHYTELKIPYPQRLTPSVALRPEIKLELVLSTTLSPPLIKQISSFIAEMLEKPPEIPHIHCVQIQDMAAEKLVSLTRRTAAVISGREGIDDTTLVRHIFDLHALETLLTGNKLFPSLVERVIQIDSEQFGNQMPEYRANPLKETAKALLAFNQSHQHAERYRHFLEPLVYSQNPPSWEEALSSLYRIARQVWGNDIIP